MKGYIVLTVGWFSHADADEFTPTPEQKRMLDELHLRKIDLSDEIFVINVGGYIGASTENEIHYTFEQGKLIRFLEPDKVDWRF